MRFIRLVISNYKSFQNRTDIDFSHDNLGNDRNILLIGGMNGAGKTSVMEAIRICLYGALSKDIFKAINRKEAAKHNYKCDFDLTYRTDDNYTITVKRGWNVPDARSKVGPNDLEESLEIIKNNENVFGKNKDLMQEYLNLTFPKGVTQFFFFDGEKIQEMASDQSSDIKLKKSLEATLGFDLFRQLTADLNNIKRDEKKSNINISEEELKLKENQISVEQGKKKKYELALEEIQDDIHNYEIELEKVKKQMDEVFGIDPENRSQDKDLLENRKRTLSNRVGEIDSHLKRIIDEALPLALLGSHFSDLKKQIEHESQLRQVLVIKDYAKDLSEYLSSDLSSGETVCCKRNLNDLETERLQTMIFDSINRFPDSKYLEMKELYLNLSDIERGEILSRINEVQVSCSGNFVGLLNEKENILTEIEELDRKMQKIPASEFDKEVYDELTNESAGYNNQIGRKKEEKERIQESLFDCENNCKKFQSEYDNMIDKYTQSLEHEAYINLLDSLISLITEYIESLQKSKIAELQQKTFEMYSRLASKGDLISSVIIDPESYNIHIKDRDNNEVQKSLLSAGEKEVFAIALLWGLARTSHLNLPIIIDTPLSRLDSVHRDNIVDNYFPSAGQQVILLSTDTEVDQKYYERLEKYLYNVIRLNFDMINESTYIEEGYFWS